ncbi:10559_t:CDS:2, partial [Acaulospora morrowiae]
LGYDEPGELCVRGPNVMKGYLNNEGATNASFDKDGFLYTGDVASIDSQELIKYKGLQVAPAELEEIIITHPAVSDAAVVGFNCEADATEYPLAYITLRTGYEQSPEIFLEIMDYVANKPRWKNSKAKLITSFFHLDSTKVLAHDNVGRLAVSLLFRLMPASGVSFADDTKGTC